MIERPIQLLACEFHVSTEVQPVLRRLDRIRTSAVQDYPVLHRHRLEVHHEANGYRVTENDEDGHLVADAEEAGALVEQRLHELAFGALADYTKVHAGLATWHGRRFLVVGDRGAGKTTLMTRLLFEACSVDGDEMVLIREGLAVAYPRRFGLRRRTLTLVPQVGALTPDILDTPSSDDLGGYHVVAFDPDQLGLAWRIAFGPIDVIFVLGPRQAGPTSGAPCSTPSVLKRLVAQSAPPEDGTAAWVRDVSAVVRGARAYELRVGDLDSAIRTMRQCLTEERAADRS